ncbi:hypothetical protein GOV05_03950 [Candidatus Woesearchaeota archaeon]|nr:hypothetical protein [Candidatus Woesearchaeota archaeon]
MDNLIIISYLAGILFIGVLSNIISKKHGLNPHLLFLLAGLLLSKLIPSINGLLRVEGDGLIQGVAILGIALVVFDAASRYRLKESDFEYSESLRTTLFTLGLNLLIISVFVMVFFDANNLLLGALVAVLVTGFDKYSKFNIKKRDEHLLGVEAIINPLITILLFVIITELLAVFPIKGLVGLLPFLLRILGGVGTGFFVGIIFFKYMRDYYHTHISPLFLLVTTLIAFLLAEAINGSGILAVASLGFLFGNIYVKNKDELVEFSQTISKSLDILIFVFLGLLINLNTNIFFLIQSFILFLVHLGLRYSAVSFAFLDGRFSLKEKLYFSFNTPKGLVIATIVLFALVSSSFEFGNLLSLATLFILYSLVLELLYSKFFEKKISAALS